MTQRDEIIAKLRNYDWYGIPQTSNDVEQELSAEECKRIIDDMEFAQFAREQLDHTEGKPALLRRKGDRKQ